MNTWYVINDTTTFHNAMSTSSLARYEYTSGDIRYSSIPANTINDLDFFLNEVNVYNVGKSDRGTPRNVSGAHHLSCGFRNSRCLD